MTISEKADKIRGFCHARRSCDGCPLEGMRNCYGKYASSKDIERNFKLIFETGRDENDENMHVGVLLESIRSKVARFRKFDPFSPFYKSDVLKVMVPHKYMNMLIAYKVHEGIVVYGSDGGMTVFGCQVIPTDLDDIYVGI